MKYPKTKQIKDPYELHGITIEDNYSWMEEKSEDLQTWIKEQNVLIQEYLGNNPLRKKFLERMKELSNYERKSLYRDVGDYLFYTKNSGLENLPKVYKKHKESGDEEVFLDPNTMSSDATSPIVSLSFSKDAKYCAYGIAKAGADWVEVFIVDIETGDLLEDHLVGIKFDSDVFSQGVSFYKHGFFYPKYINDVKQVDYSQKDIPGELWYHRISTSQQDDVLVYKEKDARNLIVGSFVDSEEHYLVLPTSTGCTGNNLVLATLNQDLKSLSFTTLIEGYDHKNQVLGVYEHTMFVLTNKDARNRKIVSYDLQSKERKDIILEGSIPIESAKLVSKYILVETLENVQSNITFYTREGVQVKKIPMPQLGNFLGMSGSQESKEGYFAVTSFLSPSQVYKINFDTLDYQLYSSTEINFNFDDYEVLQEYGTSKDSTKVPMFIVKKKNLGLNSRNPTLLYGYGGFNISLLPMFSPKILTWIESGGVFVMANLRGGGEFGEDWHEGGKKHKKQHVFDDAHACAQYLIDSNYCSSSTLAIQGGSNGGLLAAACALQRPDLYSVSLPAAAVLDMLKYQNFTCGYQWSDEYGVATEKQDFDILYSYSPYHTIDFSKEYPAFLVTCADLDDRVVSAHSYKFIAKLQQTQGKNPYLIRVETNSAHGASNLSKYLEEAADSFTFTLMNFK